MGVFRGDCGSWNQELWLVCLVGLGVRGVVVIVKDVVRGFFFFFSQKLVEKRVWDLQLQVQFFVCLVEQEIYEEWE